MLRALLVLFLVFTIVPPTRADEFSQKKIFIVNATPDQVFEFSVFDVGEGVVAEDLPYRSESEAPGSSPLTPFTGSIASKSFAYASVEEKSCVFELSAFTLSGRLFSHTLDTCAGPAVWIIYSNKNI